MAKKSEPDPGSAVQPGKGTQLPADGSLPAPDPDWTAPPGKFSWFGRRD